MILRSNKLPLKDYSGKNGIYLSTVYNNRSVLLSQKVRIALAKTEYRTYTYPDWSSAKYVCPPPPQEILLQRKCIICTCLHIHIYKHIHVLFYVINRTLKYISTYYFSQISVAKWILCFISFHQTTPSQV